ncbi:THUMP domain-containing class I SAM-dependent RNA methyltransferase [Weissella koreensis]|uniref:Class I SAM-dependent RNA methyltransferase n=1 Tax=Weissella koreensis TaxID=165096 RepID=A0A7H1MN71_9LACO|nr:class I SAM-dependent RNA methyltransferase [Weissella koreensis]AVH75705.1 class I SAM-dependent RNA methyltransferase [Weissella koreensis]EJF34694.1 site-specific DNA-methyltransferase [Weissella koreensis KCTC 3621]QGN20926.1 class I SAM-dependent RNA methyltransferase [Weissella koreensis]QNT64907.1 class I SAM-dependent RNA methyltransferase [Weissella koreensis]
MTEPTFKLMAVMGAGMEAIVAKELKNLGYQVRTENGRVFFEGTLTDIYRANLWLRVADRIKIVLTEFEAKTFEDLFQGVKAYPFEEILPYDAEFPVNGRSKGSILHSVPTVQSITKKAIVERLSETYNTRGHLPETGARYLIEAAIDKNHVMITLDTTGDSLFKRGYRTEKGGAPLKETMAAALVDLAHWFTDNPFVDPVTGSGTIPIEAALIGRNIAPGLNREFDISDWEMFDPSIGKELKETARGMIDFNVELNIKGYDIDENMIDIAKDNANKAGVGEDIEFKQLAAKDWVPEDKNGIIVANPPYGERLGDEETVRRLYGEMGDIYKNMPTWSKYILTSDEEFEKAYGEKATKKRKLYNGALKVDLYQYWGKKER